jgi:hypothetical protein
VKVERKTASPTSNVWESMGLDSTISERAVNMRIAVSKMMDENYTEINKHVDATTFPFFMKDKIKALGINGL